MNQNTAAMTLHAFKNTKLRGLRMRLNHVMGRALYNNYT